MNLNYTSQVPQMPAQRSTSFFIEDILLHKPKPLREVFPSPFSNCLASRMPLIEYGYPLMPTPILAPHPHHPLHKPEHHPYFFTSGMHMPALFQHHPELPGKHCRRRKARTVFSDSQLSGLEKRFEIQMKHKKQLRKTQDDQKTPNDVDRSLENTSESEMQEKCTDGKNGTSPERYKLDDNEDDVDIEDDICSPEHLL
uniref:Brain-specific homeobox n=1 Tax=Sinocyclocheilus anshuiensis TaxID=1608454 RepID=A0A671N9W4_9TELE